MNVMQLQNNEMFSLYYNSLTGQTANTVQEEFEMTVDVDRGMWLKMIKLHADDKQIFYYYTLGSRSQMLHVRITLAHLHGLHCYPLHFFASSVFRCPLRSLCCMAFFVLNLHCHSHC